MPIPRTMGSFIVLIGVIAGCAGIIRQEKTLLVIAAILLSIAVYCIAALLILKLLYHKRSRNISISIRRGASLSAGGYVELFHTNSNVGLFLCLPAILVRYELNLETKDGRRLRNSFNPNHAKDPIPFLVPERGAYYRFKDEFVLFDGLGLFRCAWTVFEDNNPSILASPLPDKEVIPIKRSGGRVHRKSSFIRNDQLTDSRPYMPGDDPRRINWKLYSHSGDLFVRDEEREPPPNSHIVLLLDTYTDESLFASKAQSRRAVDMLCEKALALLLDLSKRGIDIAFGFSGSTIIEGDIESLTEALAYPYALSDKDNESASLPEPDPRCAVIILALPRLMIGGGALDRFHRGNTKADIIFLYEEERLASTAESCKKIYAGAGAAGAP